MKIILTEPALADLEEIRAYVARQQPSALQPLRRYLLLTLVRIKRFPHSSPLITNRKGVRCAALLKYPYKIFYTVSADYVHILHFYHTSRDK